MKAVSSFFRISAASALLLLAAPSLAVPAKGTGPAATAATIAAIPFDPPLGQKIRFRSQKTMAKNGRSQTHWSITEVQFEKAGANFRLIVTPVQQGTESADPMVKEIMQKLSHLISRPYVLNVSSEAVITGFEDADSYWSAIFEAVEAVVSDLTKQSDPLPPAVRTALGGYLKSMREMPAEARLALLTESVQPIVEFAATEWQTAEPVVSQIETVSQFGQVKRDVRIAVQNVDDDSATMSLHSSVPRQELERLTQAALAPFAAAMPAKDGRTIAEGMKSLQEFKHETRASYSVSLTDGLLLRHESTETIEAGAGADKDKRVTSVFLERVQ